MKIQLGTHWPFRKGYGRAQRNVSLRWDSSRCLEVLSVSNQNSHLSTFKTIQDLLSRGQCRFSGSQKRKELSSCCTKFNTNLTFSRVGFFPVEEFLNHLPPLSITIRCNTPHFSPDWVQEELSFSDRSDRTWSHPRAAAG